MRLYAVVVGGVYPTQCVVAWECRESAQALADHLNATIRNVVTVEQVNSFFPSHMTNADQAWLDATDSYLAGNHHNTSSN